jgi:hypothetical protein
MTIVQPVAKAGAIFQVACKTLSTQKKEDEVTNHQNYGSGQQNSLI